MMDDMAKKTLERTLRLAIATEALISTVVQADSKSLLVLVFAAIAERAILRNQLSITNLIVIEMLFSKTNNSRSHLIHYVSSFH